MEIPATVAAVSATVGGPDTSSEQTECADDRLGADVGRHDDEGVLSRGVEVERDVTEGNPGESERIRDVEDDDPKSASDVRLEEATESESADELESIPGELRDAGSGADADGGCAEDEGCKCPERADVAVQVEAEPEGVDETCSVEWLAETA